MYVPSPLLSIFGVIETVMQSTVISSFRGIWSVPVVCSRDKSSAAWCFIPALPKSNLSSDNHSHQRISFPVQSTKFRIHMSASWSVQRVSQHSSNHGQSSKTAHTTFRKSRKSRKSQCVCHKPAQRHLNETSIHLLYFFRWVAILVRCSKSTCGMHLYPLYRCFANIEKLPPGVSPILPSVTLFW